jgi:CRISPR-associated endonuclease/helicase Cas3
MSARLPSYFRYWGKAKPGSDPPYHLLAFHCLDVAAVGRAYLRGHSRLLSFFARALGVSDRVMLDWLVFCLALHDIGKFAVTFQGQRKDLLEELQQRASTRPYSMRHDTLGARLWLKLIESSPHVLGLGRDAARYRTRLQPWMDAVTGHHGQPPGVMPGSLLAHFDSADIEVAGAFADEARSLLLPVQSLQGILTLDSEQHAEQSRRMSWWFAGVAVLADWLGSNTRFFKYRVQPQALTAYWEQAQEIAERALAAAGVLPQSPAKGQTLQDLFTAERIPSLTPLQRWAETAQLPEGPQLYLLEDVTGAGKTEAALTLAYRLMATGSGCADGIFVALPTMATANAMFDRVVEMANRMFALDSAPSCVLAHGRRHLSQSFQKVVMPATQSEADARQQDETASARCAAWLADHNKKALLASVGVGTVDQALLAVLHARHQSLRLLGLFGKVLIVDEVHACDAYMLELLERLLHFHAAAGGHAILLSATLTQRMKQKLAAAFAAGAGWSPPTLASAAYPLATRVHRACDADADEQHVETRETVRRSVRVEYSSAKDAILDRIRTELAAGRSVCWVRNTVADAVEAWESLSPELPEGHCTLFHARFAMGDRLVIEQRVRDAFGPKSHANSRRGRLVIATQVVEQSLDVDFDMLVSDLAPIDRLIQRAGRMQRHIRDAQGNPASGSDQRGGAALHVFGPEWTDTPEANWFRVVFPGAAAVYPHHGQIWLTAKSLLRRGGFAMPQDARPLIECVFGEHADVPPGLQRNAERVEGENWARTNFAATEALSLNTGYNRSGMDWHADDETPTVGALDEWQTPASTRAGEATTTVRLAKWDAERIVPWCGGGEDAWDLSSLRVVKRLIAETATEAGKAAMADALAGLPDEGKWSVLLVLSPQDGAAWLGEALDPQGRRRAWCYDKLRGLRERGSGAGSGGEPVL